MSSDSQPLGVETTGEFEAVSETELVGDEQGPAATGPARRTSRPEFATRVGEPEPLEPVLHGESGLRLLRVAEAAEARPSPQALGARLEAAVAASARTEAALGDLLRTAKFLTASIGAVRGANADLVRELQQLCSIVDGEGAQRAGLERRILRLERVLDETAREATSERRFLVAEHDAFIASLVSDHEQELSRLRQRLSELGLAPADPDPTE